MADAPGAPGRPWRRSASALALVAATALAYATSFDGALQFDDWNVMEGDPRVASLAAWWRAQPGIRPLLKLTFALDHALGLGLPARHAVNLAVHLGAALLALALLARLESWFTAGDAGSRPRAPGPPPGPGRAGAATLLGALLFALHPIQTEAVTYLSGRSSALAALLALGSAVSWLEGRAAGRAWLTRGLSPLLLAASLGVKETALALPPVLLLLAAAGPGGGGRLRRALADTAAHWLVLAAAGTAMLASPSYRAMLAAARSLRPPLENLRVHLDGLAWLAGQALAPARLLADPGPAPAGGPWWHAAVAAGVLAAVVAGGLAALLLRERAPLGLGATPGRRAVALGLLWCVAWLPPSGWLWPRPEAANDRQAYLALLGPAWLLGRWLAGGLAAGGLPRAAGALLAAALVLGLGAATAARNLVYADEVRFWADVAAKAPRSARAFNNLGLALSARCRLPEAEAAFTRALALEPDHPRARINLWLLRLGEPPGERPGQAARCPPPGVEVGAGRER